MIKTIFIAIATIALTGQARGQDTFAGGDGSQKKPWLIATMDQLQAIDRNLDGHFALTQDLDASVTATWNERKGFVPIGDQERPFKGSFDGRGHNITGLVIKRFAMVTHHIGLFGCIGEGAKVRSIRLVKVVVDGCDHTGALAGWNLGTVIDCHASGDVWGSGTYGGLIGYVSEKGRVSICQSAVNVHREWVGNHLGGLVGGNNGLIENCYANGTVQGYENPGGLVGVNRGIIRNCYATGNVISECANGKTLGAGGLVAVNLEKGSVEHCFAVGIITAPQSLACGALVGNNQGAASVLDCWFAAGKNNGIGKNTSTTDIVNVMITKEGVSHFYAPVRNPCDGWDFEQIWSYQQSGIYLFPVFKKQIFDDKGEILIAPVTITRVMPTENRNNNYSDLIPPLDTTNMTPVPAGVRDICTDRF